jgi:hypothetical protein
MDESIERMAASREGNPDKDISLPRSVIESITCADAGSPGAVRGTAPTRFMPPVSAIAPLFRLRFEHLYTCRVDYKLEVSSRATTRVLGGYYKSRRLIRLYARDREEGLRPLEDLFDTFLHEMAHHLEYTEPFSFSARSCGRVPGRMHSRLFWRILGELKYRWALLRRQQSEGAQPVR